MKPTSQDLEIALAARFDYRVNVIVPNVSWGMGLRYEADLVVLRKSDYAVEIEIKVSASDIVADTKKRHCHDSNLFRQLWFAVPQALADHPKIPARAGIIAIDINARPSRQCKTIRAPKVNSSALKWTPKQRRKLLELGVMRIWSLKSIIARTRRERYERRHTNTDS